MNRIQKICIIFFIALLMFWVSAEDFKHEVVISSEYTYNVCSGFWPDYKDLKPNCEAGE